MKFKVTKTDTIITEYMVDASTAKKAEQKVRELPLIQRSEICVYNTSARSTYQTNPFIREDLK